MLGPNRRGQCLARSGQSSRNRRRHGTSYSHLPPPSPTNPTLSPPAAAIGSTVMFASTEQRGINSSELLKLRGLVASGGHLHPTQQHGLRCGGRARFPQPGDSFGTEASDKVVVPVVAWPSAGVLSFCCTPPLTLAGASIGMERECQQNDRTLANGCPGPRARGGPCSRGGPAPTQPSR